MALFGQLSTPKKELPLIDLTSADIMMELLEEVAITASTADYIEQHEPHHPEAAELHEQAADVYNDFLNILLGKISELIVSLVIIQMIFVIILLNMNKM